MEIEGRRKLTVGRYKQGEYMLGNVLLSSFRAAGEQLGSGGGSTCGLHFAGFKELGHRSNGRVDAWQFVRVAELSLEFFLNKFQQIEQEIRPDINLFWQTAESKTLDNVLSVVRFTDFLPYLSFSQR